MSKYFKYTLILSIALLMFTYNVRPQNIKSCEELIKGENYQSAISCLRDVLRKEKKNINAHILLGTTLLQLDSTDAAIAILIQARELAPINSHVYETLGDAYLKHTVKAAAQQYELAARYDSTRPVLFLKLARAYMKLRNWNDAAAAYWRVLSIDTTDVEVYRELGKLYFQAKQYQNAVPLLQKLVSREPDSLINKILLAEALYHSRQWGELIPLAEEIILKDSTVINIISFLSEGYLNTRDYKKAEETLLLLASRDTLKANRLVDLGRAQKALDKTDEAIASFEKAYKIDSTLSDIYYDLGALYMRRKQFAEAVVMFEKKIASDTTAGFLFGSHLNAGLCLMQMKQFERARDHILSSLKIRPDYIQGWSALAACYAQMDSSEQQRSTYKKVIELITSSDPNGEVGKYNAQLEEAYRMVGLQYLLEKKYLSSLDYLKKALQFNPKDCSLLLWLGQAYHNVDNKTEAEKYYRKVWDQCPKSDPKREDAKKGLYLLGIIVEGK